MWTQARHSSGPSVQEWGAGEQENEQFGPLAPLNPGERQLPTEGQGERDLARARACVCVFVCVRERD